MEFDELLNLFDSYWFQSHPFSTSTPKITKFVEKEDLLSCTEALAMHEVREKIEPQNLKMSSKLSRTQTFMVRSQSDQCLSSKDCSFNNSDKSSQSPKSVLLVEPKLQPILSGKECNEFKSSLEGGGGVKYRRRKKQSSSKSLSELEFEELKGFMDLGFEFSDKDKDSNLVSIIPGLRRLGRESDEMDESGVSRPHLSEAWGVLDEKMKMEGKKMNILKSWRIKTDHFGNNEVEIKHQLKLWAHTVASTVK